MEESFKFCEEKTATISVSSSASCDADNLTVIDIHIDTRMMKPCAIGIVLFYLHRYGMRTVRLQMFPVCLL